MWLCFSLVNLDVSCGCVLVLLIWIRCSVIFSSDVSKKYSHQVSVFWRRGCHPLVLVLYYVKLYAFSKQHIFQDYFKLFLLHVSACY